MIVSMVKYTFILHHSEQEKFLETLGGLGVVDVTINPYDPSPEELQLMGRLTRYRQTAETLKNTAFDKEEETAENRTKDADEFAALFERSKIRMEEIDTELAKTAKELSDAEPWGDFSGRTLEDLRANGIRLRFFITGEKQYDPAWEEQYPVYLINKHNGNAYFVLAEKGEEIFGDPSKFGNETRLPGSGYSGLKARFEALENEKKELRKTLHTLAGDLETLEKAAAEAENELHFIRIKQGNNTAAEGSLVVIEGWAPKEKAPAVDAFNETDQTAISFKEKPTPEDNPPILLKNNKFAQTNEVITRLYSLPNYHETDITAFFAPFFILFVGVCLGDLGYGLFILLVSIIAKFFIKNKAMKPVLNLVMWCSLASVIMGFLTGSFFGTSITGWKMFEGIQDIFIEQNSMFTFSIAVGILQILYAVILRAVFNIRRFGFKYSLTYFGWASMVIACILAFILPKFGVESFSFSSLAFKLTMGVSLVLMLFFYNPDKKLLTSFGLGIYGLYNNITGFLGDVLSYIRLFALGLSSGVIASSFNSLAVGMSSEIDFLPLRFLAMAIILLIGHGINLFMAVIGSFVHPLRLTFVEFYKNVGFEGGGRAYTPFSRKAKKAN